MQNNKKFAYKLMALPILVSVLSLVTVAGSAAPSMAQEPPRFDGEELRGIAEETTISALRLAENPNEDQSKDLAGNACLSFITWSFGPLVDTDWANDACNIEEE